jgi:hypothetical protein
MFYLYRSSMNIARSRDSSVLLYFCGRLRLKCDGTRTETRFRLSTKRTSPFKSAAASVQSTTGSRGVRINGSNAGYPKFRGSVKSTGYQLHSPVLHRVPSHFNWTLTCLRAASSSTVASWIFRIRLIARRKLVIDQKLTNYV